MNDIQHVPSTGQPPRRPVDKRTPRRPQPRSEESMLSNDATPPPGSAEASERARGIDVRI
jgi:hypothetical protein